MEIYKHAGKGLLAFVFALGCSHKTEKEIQRKVSEESHVQTIEDFTEASDKVINEAQGISDAQRAKLVVLRRETLEKIDQQDQEEIRLRLVLLKEILDFDENRFETNLVRQKLRKVHAKKYSLLMDAVRETYAIIGKPYVDSKNSFENEHTVQGSQLR